MENNNTSDPKLLLMPKPLAAEQQTTLAEADPPETSNSPLAFSGPLTRESLSEYSETQLIRNAKKVIPRAFRALAKLVDQGDRKALELALTTYSYVGKGGGGITIVNNVLQQNNGGGGQNRDNQQEVYFESILRKIEKEEQVNRREIIDVEVEDE